MATFWVYCDESGIHDGADWCLVCGYAGADIAWVDFDAAWRKVLHEAGVPNDDFHANRFFNRDGTGERLDCYAEWTDEKAKQFIMDLTAAVNGYYIYPVGMSVKVADFFSFSVGERRYLTGGTWKDGGFKGITGAPSKPYYLAFNEVIVSSVERTPDDGSVTNFMFDRQHVLQQYAVQAFDDVISEVTQSYPKSSKKIGKVSYGERSRHPGLQAADMITHLWYVYSRLGNSMSAERHLALGELSKKFDRIFQHTKDTMERELAKLPPPVRESMRLSE